MFCADYSVLVMEWKARIINFQLLLFKRVGAVQGNCQLLGYAGY